MKTSLGLSSEILSALGVDEQGLFVVTFVLNLHC